MNIQQALNIFGLSGELSEKDIKSAYKKASLKFHPDRNQGDQVAAEMMKAVNCAYDFLMQNLDKINAFQSEEATARYNYGEELENVLKALHALSGVIFEVTGNWIWISGETKTHKESLKSMGCKWANQKKMWFYRPEEYKATNNRKSHSMDEIRAMYGTTGEYKAKGSRQLESRL
ncbi:DnaJ domain-containing protein [Proteus mirabilis]|uniref:J domain-containing protein n=1 Tax=Proteus mirabilis TaxID=584 RepID=UPI001BB0AF98|nr:J domain-containing protein [Proteus mirabilis]MCS6741700.1 DnaJ domain-containing protein [Acinetobacter baumannii]EKW7428839.1 DnaJ domain-containing protein [Proteus mirabilis]MBS3881229.1 DnaJ domain-containing protein [Proteus mirabilis]MCS6721223.1 DnaJ domain-containing protein [Proteus mirabilis]MCS6727928.1 DnaJ domain-containing protein [Proteus mirabilis]